MNFENIAARLARLRTRMAEEHVDIFVLVVTENYNCESMEYISGFRGSSGSLLISCDEAFLVTDGRYALQAATQSPFTLIMQERNTLQGKTAEVLVRKKWSRGGFEADRLSVSLFRELEPSLPRWKDCSSILPSLRRRKDDLEVSLIRRAADIAYSSYDEVLGRVREGMTEKELNALLEFTLRNNGAEEGWKGSRFIVASGERSALPHGTATERAFRKGDMVTVDFGATYEGYISDLTRNFSMGPLPGQGREIESVLLEAAEKALSAVRPGVEGKLVDSVARDVITSRGWGKHFSHGLGHGLGLEVHEAPRLSPSSKDILHEGDVVTIEPGIYVEGWGGMRIEDDYLVMPDGPVCLSGGKGRNSAMITI
jgi:Xaa-Pro aminopeptidase